MKIAIIGTAGREKDLPKLSVRKYYDMYNITCSLISKFETPIELISGGAAWADHLAVLMFISGNADKLHLKLPAHITDGGKYEDVWINNFTSNPGRTSNYHHHNFSTKIQRDSLADILRVTKMENCTVDVGSKGFFERNSIVAKEADICIAFTFGNGAVVADGGTFDTVKKFLKKKLPDNCSFHVDLNTMITHSPALLK